MPPQGGQPCAKDSGAPGEVAHPPEIHSSIRSEMDALADALRTAESERRAEVEAHTAVTTKWHAERKGLQDVISTLRTELDSIARQLHATERARDETHQALMRLRRGMAEAEASDRSLREELRQVQSASLATNSTASDETVTKLKSAIKAAAHESAHNRCEPPFLVHTGKWSAPCASASVRAARFCTPPILPSSTLTIPELCLRFACAATLLHQHPTAGSRVPSARGGNDDPPAAARAGCAESLKGRLLRPRRRFCRKEI